MKVMLRKLWESRAPRERRVIAVLAAVLAAAAYLLLLHSADRARGQLRTSVAALRTQAALLEQQANEHERLRSTPAPAGSTTDLRTLVQTRVDAARLAGALTRLDAPDAEHVQITFGALSFADWLSWLAALQTQQVRLEAARVEGLSAPGMVSVTATLTRAKAP
jgi:general secretion pathway protein M